MFLLAHTGKRSSLRLPPLQLAPIEESSTLGPEAPQSPSLRAPLPYSESVSVPLSKGLPPVLQAHEFTEGLRILGVVLVHALKTPARLPQFSSEIRSDERCDHSPAIGTHFLLAVLLLSICAN